MQRVEQNYSGGWVNSARLTYQYNVQGWQSYEEREEWSGGAWQDRYDTAQSYDNNGNRSSFHRNVAAGHGGTFGRNVNLSYKYDVVNRPTTLSDADEAGYAASCKRNPFAIPGSA